MCDSEIRTLAPASVLVDYNRKAGAWGTAGVPAGRITNGRITYEITI